MPDSILFNHLQHLPLRVCFAALRVQCIVLPRAFFAAASLCLQAIAIAGTSTVRTSGGESKGAIEKAPLKHGSSDAFSLGLLGLCLLFCKPFLGSEQKHLDRLDVSYYSQNAYR